MTQFLVPESVGTHERAGEVRRKLRASTIAGVLTVAASLSAADASPAWSIGGHVAWGGDGFYAWDTTRGIYGGPYSDEADCNAAVAANAVASERGLFMCVNMPEAEFRHISFVRTVSFSGSGYYVSDPLDHGMDYVSGPYSGKDECENAIVANIEAESQSHFGCDYVPDAQTFDTNTQAH